MSVITLNIPETANVKPFDIEMMVAAKLYEEGKVTSGQAAEIVGISKRAFIELLGKYNVSFIGYNFNELQAELQNV